MGVVTTEEGGEEVQEQVTSTDELSTVVFELTKRIFHKLVPSWITNLAWLGLSIDLYSNGMLNKQQRFTQDELVLYLAGDKVMRPLGRILDSLNLLKRTKLMDDENDAREHQEVIWQHIEECILEVGENISRLFPDDERTQKSWEQLKEELIRACNAPETVEL
jgi:hypothetical protein